MSKESIEEALIEFYSQCSEIEVKPVEAEVVCMSADNFMSLVEEAWLACTNQGEVIVVDGHVYMSLELLLRSLPFIKPMLQSIDQVLRKCVNEKKMGVCL